MTRTNDKRGIEMNLFDSISLLLKMVKTGPYPHDGMGYTGHTRTVDGKNLYFSGQDIKTFENVVEEIWKHNTELYETVSLKTVKDKIIKLLEKQVFDGDPITSEDAGQLIGNLLSMKIQEWEVFRPLYGGTISPITPPFELGPFTIYHIDHHKDVILEKYPHANSTYDIHREYIETDLFISVIIKARDNRRANELSESRFRQFENIFKYMLGPSNRFDVAIFDFKDWRVSESLLLSSKTATSSSSGKGSLEKLPLNDNFFQSDKNGNKLIWEKLKLRKLTDLEQSIFAAINWIGKGVKEEDPANSFIQYIFALESLFTFQKKGVLVSPSIANQLAEFTAFILGEDLLTRTQYLRTVKNLYGKRSAVAHGGSQNILKDEVIKSYRLVKNLIVTLITHPELKDLKTIDELQQWVDGKKYS